MWHQISLTVCMAPITPSKITQSFGKYDLSVQDFREAELARTYKIKPQSESFRS